MIPLEKNRFKSRRVCFTAMFVTLRVMAFACKRTKLYARYAGVALLLTRCLACIRYSITRTISISRIMHLHIYKILFIILSLVGMTLDHPTIFYGLMYPSPKELWEKVLFYWSQAIWNGLPKKIRHAKNVKLFKKQ